MKSIPFEVATEYGVFCDALWVAPDTPEEEIEALKQARVGNWIAIVTALPPEEAE